MGEVLGFMSEGHFEQRNFIYMLTTKRSFKYINPWVKYLQGILIIKKRGWGRTKEHLTFTESLLCARGTYWHRLNTSHLVSMTIPARQELPAPPY